jgi:hypothetical protein
VRTESLLARRFSCRKATARLKPLPFFVDQTDECDRRVGELRREHNERIEYRFVAGIEHLIGIEHA